MNISQIWIDEVPSTNSWLKERCGDFPMPAALIARRQTAGRGQRGNSWESEPDMNLTLSCIFTPPGTLPVTEQFRISEAVSLSVADFLKVRGVEAKVKWPNDIYVGERKICGILIENSLLGNSLSWSVAGIGLNLNQKRFVSDAPNPVSLVQLTGREENLEEAATELLGLLQKRIAMLEEGTRREALHKDYHARLWRHDGASHPFRDRRSGECFFGRVTGVEADGTLRLTGDDGAGRSFLFKEVSWLPETPGIRFAAEPEP